MNAEKENLFRQLQDKELFVTYWGCKFGLHKWLKYGEPKEVKIDYFTNHIIQERRCGSCNIARSVIVRKVKS